VTALAEATKDDLILTALAVLGGETREVNERDLFLTAWHAFPSTMRWVDTALPNPDTFTAALRRLDQRGYIRRVGKQQRATRGRPRRRGPLDAGRSGVVKARIVDGAMERAGISPELLEAVRQLVPDGNSIRSLSDPALIVLCVALREESSRHLDEGAIVELAFHKFPSRFAYEARPEFPDVGRVRAAIADARADGLLDGALALTHEGRSRAEIWRGSLHVRLDASRAHAAGDLKFAARIEASPGFQAYAENRTVVRTKPDELFRMLRVPPTTDPKPVGEALKTRLRALRRVDKGDIADYLVEVAQKHNPDVASFLAEEAKPTE
jgi:hypothetical protein